MKELVRNIQETVKLHKQGIYEAISRDYKEKGFEIKYNILDLKLKELEKKEKIKEYQNKTILAVYNGSSYLMLELIIKAVLNGKNIILISDGEEYYTNRKILSIFQEAIEKTSHKILIKMYYNVDIRKILDTDSLIDGIIFCGDKREFRQLKLKTNIDIKYNGSGSICVYVDDEDEFEDELYNLEKYAYLNNLSINKFTEEIDGDIEWINKDVENNTCIIFSKDEEKIKKFKEKVNSRNMFVNEIKEVGYELPEELFV